MLDFSAIPIIDNHCHPIVRQQKVDIAGFRGYLTEATSVEFAHKHVPNSVYYLWFLRQLAQFHDCERNEAAILAARDSL
ncbi:MAG TPA: hypothetical protein VFN23_18550, partial [Ktedonobacteraceae bacterium]|nr:hypothetical protein [Ktedonobacteraceae bacterium]